MLRKADRLSNRPEPSAASGYIPVGSGSEAIRNISTGGYRLRFDTSVILYAVELEAPALTETARRHLEAEAARLGVSLDPRRRSAALRTGRYGDAHYGAACELVAHLAATEVDSLGEDSPVMVLARAGALALMTRIELGDPPNG